MTRQGPFGPPTLILATGLVASQVFGCSREPPKTVEPPMSTVEVAQAAPQSENDSFVIAESIRTKCSLPQMASTSPQFDFDQAALRPRGEGILDGIATCITTGSMKGEGVIITGHTDPRGSDGYNQGLGMLRANAARTYLESKGVAGAQITVKSRGEQDATGQTEAEFQLDRRVEIAEASASQ